MAKTLYLLRHCATPENEKGINGSRTDSPLSKNGMKTANELRTTLSKFHFDLLIVSPLQRTMQTIQPYLDSLNMQQEILVEPLTIERDLGDFTNTITDDGKIPSDIETQGVGKTKWQPKGGESTVQVGLRAKEFLQRIKARPEKTIIICGHQNFLRCLELVIRGEPIDDEHFYSDNPPGLKNGEIRTVKLE